MERPKMLIGGEWVEALSGEVYDNTNPATGEGISQAPAGGPADMDRPVGAAQQAFGEHWEPMPPTQRAELIFRLADAIDAHTDELARMDSTDMGKPFSQSSTGDVPGAAAFFRYYAGLVDKLEGETLITPTATFGYTLHEPYGVVAAIVPWNFPLCMCGIKAGPALAAGNCVIIKPASPSPTSALALGALAEQVGFPPGVIQVVTGPGGSAGARLAGHPGVGKVSFTGSTEVGRKIIEASVHNIAKVTLELGGKTANLVLPDADLDMALPAAARTIFLNCGQICTAGSRLLLHEDMKADFLARLLPLVERMPVGDPFAPATKLGPISSQQQYDAVMRYIASGREQGAKVLIGGDRSPDPALAKGLYVLPTVFDEVTPDMRIAQEEIFGPVLAVMTYRTLDEAIEIANATDYGLAAALWTRNLSAAHNVAKRLEAGIIWINCTNVFGPWMPYGGYKVSGLGFEAGMEGLKEFTRVKTVLIDTSDKPELWACN